MSGKRKFLFINRDGALIRHDANSADGLHNIRLTRNVIPALCRLRDAGYEIALFTDVPDSAHLIDQQAVLDEIFGSQGVAFTSTHVCAGRAGIDDNLSPRTALAIDYLKQRDWDVNSSFVVSSRTADRDLSEQLGVAHVPFDASLDWLQIAQQILTRNRRSTIQRKTNETCIHVCVDLDGSPESSEIATGIGFFDHMLDQLSRHGGLALQLTCQGDLQVDPHHTIEDVALALGTAIDQALGDRRGIDRYGFLLAMDEAQSNVAVDLSGRPVYVQRGRFTTDRVGDFPTEMVQHFFSSLAQSLRAAIQIEFQGENNHHMIESMFKGVGRALRQGFRRSGHELPSTKGVI